MNRNNGREIAERLHLLRNYFIKHADRSHAVSMADLQRHLSNEGFIGGMASLSTRRPFTAIWTP